MDELVENVEKNRKHATTRTVRSNFIPDGRTKPMSSHCSTIASEIILLVPGLHSSCENERTVSVLGLGFKYDFPREKYRVEFGLPKPNPSVLPGCMYILTSSDLALAAR